MTRWADSDDDYWRDIASAGTCAAPGCDEVVWHEDEMFCEQHQRERAREVRLRLEQLAAALSHDDPRR